mgnify:CR=1 FL=1
MPENQNKEQLIFIDDLTGLFNRRYLYHQLEQELKDAHAGAYKVWVMMIDVDNFKNINDTYGHISGDEAIKWLAEFLKENTKANDQKIRYAGDEFTVIFSKVEQDEITRIGERLISKIKTIPFKEKRSGKEIPITISAGFANFPQDAITATELIDRADKALYVSKQKGKDCFSFASEIDPELFWKKNILERFPCPVFVDREKEVRTILENLTPGNQLGKNSLFIHGVLGAGKSRLLNEIEKRLVSWQAYSISLHCSEKYTTQPYYTAGEILHKLASTHEHLPQDIFKDFPLQELTALFSFAPLLQEISGLTVDKTEIKDDPALLYNSLKKFFINMSQQKKIYIFLDDTHFIDKESMQLFFSLSENKNSGGIFILSAYSHDELNSQDGQSLPFGGYILEQDKKGAASYLIVDSFSFEDAKVMISHILQGGELSEEFYQMIYEITHGNPLFNEEMLKYFIEKEFIVYQKGRWTEKKVDIKNLPHSLKDVLGARLESLSPEIREMIAKAAVIGENFQVDLLQKIDSEDKGYVIDLIEAAKKIGLVYENKTGEKNEFSFVTSEIRKVLFNAIGDNRTKNLYSRLGQLKEKLNPEKLSSIAGELYYNFKKAEDIAATQRYADLIKEGKSEFYDRTVKYAQKIIEETAKEKAIELLPKESLALMPEIIRYIYMACVNTILYPPKSEMRLKAVSQMHNYISKVLEKVPALIFSYADGVIIANRKKLGKDVRSYFVEAFISLLRSINIESINFSRGLEAVEIEIFVEKINQAQEQSKEISDLLKEANLKHIKVNEKTYGVSGSKRKDKEGLEEMMLMDYLMGKMSTGKESGSTVEFAPPEEIAETLKKIGEEAAKQEGKDKEAKKAEVIARSIQKIGNQFVEKGGSNWGQYKENLAKAVLSMDPNLRAGILAAEVEDLDDLQGKVDIIKELGGMVPQDVIIEVLSSQYTKEDSGIEKMRVLAKRFLSSSQNKDKLSAALKDKLKILGAKEEECSLIIGEQNLEELSPQDLTKKITGISDKDLLKLLPAFRPEKIIKELALQGNEAEIQALVEKISSLIDKQPLNDPQLISVLKRILEVSLEISYRKIFIQLIQKILKSTSANLEKHLPAFLELVSPYFSRAMDMFYHSGRFDEIAGMLNIVVSSDDVHRKFASELDPLAKKIVDELIRRIENNQDWMKISELVFMIKEQAMPYLLDSVLFENKVIEGKYFEAYVRRCSISLILRQICDSQLINLVKEKFTDTRAYIIKNLIEVVAAMGNDDIINTLETPLRHGELSVRKKVIFALGKSKGKESARLLKEALKDTDAGIRSEALAALSERQDEFVYEYMCQAEKDLYVPDNIRNDLALLIKKRQANDAGDNQAKA